MLTDRTNAKSIIMWSLTDGSVINGFDTNDKILSFAWSPDGRLVVISDLPGSIGLHDLVDDYRTRATISEVCGMMKFFPDCRCLYCLVFNSARCNLFCLDVNMENEEVSYQPWEFESCNETGLLLGDPFYLPSERDAIHSWEPGLAF